MAQYATKDELNELTGLVRTLQGNIKTLDTSVGELDTLVERINHLATLKDVTITYITEGDLLQYASDGTWHNIQPSALGIGGGEGGGVVDTSVVKALIKSEGSKLFISKLYDDVSSGIITFNGGLRSNKMTYLNQGVQIGTFVTGMIGGTGAQIDKDGRGEMTSLILREFLEVPELRFNKIDVVSGELWNSIAFGTIEDVDLINQIVTLKLEEGEYSGIHVNDICRGIFHNFDGVNNTETGTDDCGFDKVQGFSTAYFTPIEVLDARGKQFRYSLKQGTTQHPCKAMKFAVYGNFTDETRRSSAYATRTYKRYLKGVNTWALNYTNIASQFGNLNGLTIPGAPNNGQLQGDGAYLTNVYMTGSIIEFTPEQLDQLHGQDAYAVSLSSEFGTVIVDNEFNIIEDYNQTKSLTFAVQAWKGKTELTYSTVYNEGSYFVEYTPTGVECTMQDGVFKVTKITNINDMRIDLVINCEGAISVNRRYNMSYQLEANGLWVTYNDNDATPDRPVGDGTSYGWHRNYTASAIWMSTKSSRKVDEGEWGDPNRFRGASVEGSDGQYTVFCYTNSSVQPPKPTSTQIPPVDDNYTWYMYPPKRESKEVFTWMIQATVYPDKSLSGWTDPIRLTGETGEDGSDGTKLEFIYQVTSVNEAPDKPDTSQQDDYIPFGWSDSPQGVSKEKMYEWVSQREKKAAKIGEGVWGEFTQPVLWSKWGEKGMDGDGYEYIFTRTADVDRVPQTPSSIQQNDYIPTISNGGSKDYNWSDDPKGVNEDYKAEWTCKRVRTDGVWSNFSTPALWSNWGEQGLSGGHYQYRWKVSATKPAIPTDTAASGWTTDSEIVPPEGQYVWQIQRFANPDGTLTAWSNLIRLTGADGEDGKDGNSIEFIYTRNADGKTPSTPASVNQAGHIPSGWSNHPQGVTASLVYEWVSQRYLDKATQVWGNWSTPGIWSRYAERGKDGDGYEYIYKRFSNYVGGDSLGPGGSNYPPANVDSSEYQADDYVPSGWSDNPVGPTESIPYEYVWTRKKENSKWHAWKTGALWAKWSKDGEPGRPGQDGKPGEPGEPGKPGSNGYSITVNGCPSAIRSSEGFLQTTNVKLSAIKVRVDDSATSSVSGYWKSYYLNSSGSWQQINSTSGTTFTSTWNSSLSTTKFWFGFTTDSGDYSSLSPTSQYKVWSAEVPVVFDGDVSDIDETYTIMRDRGQWRSGVQYYHDKASNAIKGQDVSSVTNYYLYSTDQSVSYDTTNWSTNVPTNTYAQGKLHSYSKITYSDGTITKTIPEVLLTYSNSRVTSVTQYFANSTNTSVPSEGWSTNKPALNKDKPYLFRYFTVNYVNSDSQSTSTNSTKKAIAKYQNDYTQYQNYDNLTIIDYVVYQGNVYLAKQNNTSQTPSMTSSYWNISSKQEILTVNNLLANNAKLGDFNFSGSVFTSNNGKLSMNSNTGRFVCTDVNITGSITATSGTFNGTVNASGGNFSSVKINSGQIAGFEISGNHIGSSATASGSGGGLSINPDFIRVGNSTSYVMIGSDTVPATVGGAFTATGRFVNHNYNASTQYGFDSANYGLYVDVANGTKNYALYSPNAAVRAAAVYGDTLNVVSITGSTYKLDMSKGNIIMIRANREYNVNLPNAHDVASMFGYKSLPTYFAIHVRIMIHPDTSGVTISGYFRPNNTVNQSVYLHPGNSMGFLVTNYPSFRWVETDYAGQ